MNAIFECAVAARRRTLGIMVIVVCLCFSSCNEFLEVELPTTLVAQELVFNDDISATSAIKGLYIDLVQIESFSSGSSNCAATLTGLSSDELDNYPNSLQFLGFEQNNIPADNGSIESLWRTAYKAIYDANSAIEGLRSAKSLTASLKDQLLGEALFIRAYCYFYLINLFGDVPLVSSTNYLINSKVIRTPAAETYNLIIEDLREARMLTSENYQYQSAAERVRVNRSTVTALLARAYLYLNNWQSAEEMASVIIQNTTVYNMESNLNQVFLSGSKEAIWQLKLPMSASQYYTTYEGYFFNIESAVDLSYNILSEALVNSFEPGDLRRLNWINSYSDGTDLVFYPNKYKVKNGSNPSVENSTVFRLAEQFLIRAEARANQNKLTGAIADLDVVRKRAGLPLIQDSNSSITKEDLLLAIERERRAELFTEGGHRWFDLKRTNRLDQILSPIKPGWSPEDRLYPIPQSEFGRNPNLQNQNPGY